MKNTKTILDVLDRIETRDNVTLFSHGELSTPEIFNKLLRYCQDNKKKGDKLNIILVTWQVGQKHIQQFQELVQDPDIEFKLLLDISYRGRHKDYFKRLETWIGEYVWVTKNHSKIMLFSTPSVCFTVLGSANFNRNFRLEFFHISKDKELYDEAFEIYSKFFEGDPIAFKKSPQKVRHEFHDVAEKLLSEVRSKQKIEDTQNIGCPWLKS